MPRIPRSYLKTQYFHVITQGLNKSYIFEKAEDIKYYIKIMYKLEQDQSVKIISYCIMNNHAHMLIRSEFAEELGKYMQRLNTKYAMYYNKKYQRVGYVFKNRYKSEGIYDKRYLYNCINYIYNNPVKAGICNNASEYPYSNYKKINLEASEEYKFVEIDENYKFMEADENEEVAYKSIIRDFLSNNQIELKDLKKDNKLLKEIIVTLRKYGVSLRKIATETNISREKIRKLFNECNR